jgi:hypothetical protein
MTGLWKLLLNCVEQRLLLIFGVGIRDHGFPRYKELRGGTYLWEDLFFKKTSS